MKSGALFILVCIIGKPKFEGYRLTVGYPRASEAYFGQHVLPLKKESGQVRRVVAVIKHEGYNWENRSYDIAMILLDSPVSYNSHIRPIALSNYSLDEVTNCSISGLAGTKAGRGLQSVYFHKLSLQHEKFLGVTTSRNSTPLDGDSGSALVCFKGSMPVAQGIMSNFLVDQGFFISIVHLLPWIINAYDRMREHNFHLPDLASCDARKSANDWQLLAHVKYYMERMMMTDSLEMFEKEIDLRQQERETLTDIYVQANIDVQEKKFYVHNLQGYSLVKDREECAVICYERNKDGTCSYLCSVKRCYFSGSQNNTFVYIEDSVGISFRDRKISPDLPTKLDPQMAGNVGVFWPAWNVSVQYGNQPFQCIGHIELGGKVAEIEATSSCLLKMGNGSLDFDSSITLVSQPNKMIKIFDLPRSHSTTIDGIIYKLKILKDDQIAGSIRHLNMRIPTIRTYEPTTGAFVSQPYTMPWLVHDDNSENVCTGALLNESHFHKNGRNDRTKFVLTTLTCLLSWISPRKDVYAGSYFRPLWSSTRKIFKQYANGTTILMIADIIDGVPLEDVVKRSIHKFGIIQTSDDFVFDQNIQPISLFNGKVEDVLKSRLFIANWDTMAVHPGDPLYIIPVELAQQSDIKNSTDFPSHVETRRLYFKGRVTNDKFTTENPLITCDQSNTQCQLLGFSQSVTENGRELIESHITLQQSTKFIRNKFGYAMG